MYAGRDYSVLTYIRHTWVFRHPETGEDVGIYVGKEGDTQYDIV